MAVPHGSSGGSEGSSNSGLPKRQRGRKAKQPGVFEVRQGLVVSAPMPTSHLQKHS
jgi:hypothetical protein